MGHSIVANAIAADLILAVLGRYSTFVEAPSAQLVAIEAPCSQFVRKSGRAVVFDVSVLLLHREQ